MLGPLPIPPRAVQLVTTPKYSRRQAKDHTRCSPYTPIASPLVVTRLDTPESMGDSPASAAMMIEQHGSLERMTTHALYELL